jgi:maleylacetate reductase
MLRHKLCHELGGSFGLPHVPTHTEGLPYAMAHTASAAPVAVARIAEAMRVPDAVAGVHDAVSTFGDPMSLGELGFDRADVDRVGELATAEPYLNSREVTRDGVAAPLKDANAGRPPGGTRSSRPRHASPMPT